MNAMLAGFFQGPVQERDQAFCTFEREGLGCRVFFSNKLFENGGVREFCIDSRLHIMGQSQPVLGRFHAPLKPIANVAIVDVHELRTNTSAVGVPKFLNDVGECATVGVFKRRRSKGAFEVLFGQTMRLRVQLWGAFPGQPQRIDAGHKVPAHTVLTNQLVHSLLHACKPQDIRGWLGRMAFTFGANFGLLSEQRF